MDYFIAKLKIFKKNIKKFSYRSAIGEPSRNDAFFSLKKGYLFKIRVGIVRKTLCIKISVYGFRIKVLYLSYREIISVCIAEN